MHVWVTLDGCVDAIGWMCGCYWMDVWVVLEGCVDG